MRAQRSFTCLPVSFSSPPMTFRRIYLFGHFNDDHLLQTDKIISGPHKSDWTCFLVVFVLIRPFKLVICWALRVNCTCTRIDYSTRLGIFIEGRYILPCPPNYRTCSSTWEISTANIPVPWSNSMCSIECKGRCFRSEVVGIISIQIKIRTAFWVYCQTKEWQLIRFLFRSNDDSL